LKIFPILNKKEIILEDEFRIAFCFRTENGENSNYFGKSIQAHFRTCNRFFGTNFDSHYIGPEFALNEQKDLNELWIL
jgi:hypothetical protein